MNLEGGYQLVSTVYTVEDDVLPFELDENLRFEKASEIQIADMKESAPMFGVDLKPYEHELRKEHQDDPGHYRIFHDPLPAENHRFLLLTFRGSNYLAYRFMQLSSALEPPMRFSYLCHTKEAFGLGKGMGWGGLRQFIRPLFRTHEWDVHFLSKAHLEEVKSAWLGYNNVIRTFPFVEKVISMIYDLENIPRNHDLYFLGLFAILELMLTHNPQDRENADSLNHQISTKVPLLGDRMANKPDYSVFAQGIAEQKLWKLLYGVRSKIAHGAVTTFDGGDFQALRSREVALDFLDQTTRRIALHAIREPALFEKLKPI